LLARQEWWWLLAIPAIVVSQALIIAYWRDARFGTVANVVLALAIVVAYAGWQFHRSFQLDVRAAQARATAAATARIDTADLQRLPAVVQRYLVYVGVPGHRRPGHVRVEFSGQMRGRGKGWFAFRSRQYNFFDLPTRLFFMRGRMFGLTVPGYHAYRNGTASMLVKLFALVPVADFRGAEMDTAETVTVFNDMCLLAPATLLDPRVEWLESDQTSARAAFSTGRIRITARLLFNQQGQLVNFISDDRYDVSGAKPVRLRWSTPVHAYTSIAGFNLPAAADTIWHDPQGEFCYGTFRLERIEYDGPVE
jgi:hypothetical protein